jgi:Tfp pilus assembly protein PilF
MLLRRRISHAQGYLELGMLAEAEAELEQITGAAAQSNEVLAVRLAVLHEQHNWPAVRDLARELVQRNPAEPAMWVTWAYATRRTESLEAAESILLEAEKLHPVEPTIHFNLGCYACQRGDVWTAKRRVDAAAGLDPKFIKIAETDPDLEALRAWRKQTDCQPGA